MEDARKTNKDRAGFTLVELVVVIAILGVLAGVAYAGYGGYLKYAKRAGDEDLISAANAAFASACEDKGVDRAGLPNGGATLKGDSDKKINGVSMILGLSSPDIADFNDAFSSYYAGNEETELQYYTRYQIQFDGKNDIFIFNENAFADPASVLKDSKHDVDSLSTPVKSLNDFVDLLLSGKRHGENTFTDGILADILKAAENLDLTDKIDAVLQALSSGGSSGSNLIDEDTKGRVIQRLRDLGLQEDASYNEIINGVVLCAAEETVNGNLDVNALADAVLSGDQTAIEAAGGDLAAFPMIMGKLAAYRKYESCSNEFKKYYDDMFSVNGNWGASGSKILEQLKNLGKIANDDPNWGKYCDSGQAKKDMDGYIAALQLLCANSDKVDLTDSNAIGDGDFADLMNQMLGNS